MNNWENLFIATYGLIGLILGIWGFIECHKKENAHGETFHLFSFGIFVWGDAVIFGIFWFLAAIASLILQDWLLFLLIISSFWLVRSIGETFYWFNQQFSKVILWPPHTLRYYRFFRNDSIWFIYQIGWQCITVASLISTLYLSALWIHTKI